MFAKSQLMDLRTRMLLRSVESLENVHGFQDVMITEPDRDFHQLRFIGDKPIYEKYVGARVLLLLTYFSNKKLWGVSSFTINSVYLGHIDMETDKRWRKTRKAVLPGDEFLAYMNKVFADADGKHLDNTMWTISCGRDFTAFCESYDNTARMLGYAPVFLG